MDDTTLTSAELARLLDVYGTERERWPAPAWDAAQRLVATTPAVRRLWDEAAALDRMLSDLPPSVPSPELVARVLAAAPAPRLPARWRRAATALLPLAAAAGLALWFAYGTTTAPLPQAVDLTSLQLGEYTSPTDALLNSSGVDVGDGVPAFGCDDSTLGCPTLDSGSVTATREET